MIIVDSFKIIGISVRTTNKENKATKDIGNLWGMFYSENIIKKIQNRISDDIFSIYTDYINNFQDEYITIIGVSVPNLDSIPEGMVGREFPTENFKVFDVNGSLPGAIIDTWREIWRQDNELQRKYSYDFELYKKAGLNTEDQVVKIFISLK
jgi:predicted transcriptional regulator YdeE